MNEIKKEEKERGGRGGEKEEREGRVGRGGQKAGEEGREREKEKGEVESRTKPAGCCTQHGIESRRFRYPGKVEEPRLH